jgi:hopene-associated glycosyltransferase HpnB
VTVLAGLALLVWLTLILLHGHFWQSGPSLAATRPRRAPPVAIVVPARDEAGVIVATLRSLLTQDYPGRYRVILVDDGSADGTGALARGLAREVNDRRLSVLDGTPPPSGWSGKLWAVAQGIDAGIDAGLDAAGDAELLLLTDADIVHDPRHLSALVARAEQDGLDLVSEMVALACDSTAERALVPAFVYFFQLLYPFAWVNDPLRATAAAAGGTILIRRRALDRIGGIAAVRGALIDDVALARAVKRGGRIWLGHSVLARSVRSYPDFAAIWRLVARTAYVQLGFSPLLLVATTLGMALTFVVPPAAALFGHGLARVFGVLAWGGMAWSYLPTLGRFGRSPAWAVALPAVALFYLAATIGAAVDQHRGRGARWKQRDYSGMRG